MINKKIFKSEKGLKFLITFSLMIVLLTSFVSAFTIGGPGKVALNPGQSTDTGFSLQNGFGTEDIIVEGVITEGSEYASFTEGTRFIVPAGSKVPARIRVSVPANADVGDVYPISLSFNTVSGGDTDGGTIDFSKGYSTSFNVEVTPIPVEPGQEVPAAEGISMIWWILGILVVIIVIVVIWISVKNKKPDVAKPAAKPVKK